MGDHVAYSSSLSPGSFIRKKWELNASTLSVTVRVLGSDEEGRSEHVTGNCFFPPSCPMRDTHPPTCSLASPSRQMPLRFLWYTLLSSVACLHTHGVLSQYILKAEGSALMLSSRSKLSASRLRLPWKDPNPWLPVEPNSTTQAPCSLSRVGGRVKGGPDTHGLWRGRPSHQAWPASPLAPLKFPAWGGLEGNPGPQRLTGASPTPLPSRLPPHCAVRLGFCCQSPGRGQPGTWPHYVPDLRHTSPTQGLGLLEASSMGQSTSPQNSWRPAQLFGGGGR